MTNTKSQARVNVSAFLKDVKALNNGYRRYPKALSGLKGSLTKSETASVLSHTDKLYKGIAKLEKSIDAKYAELKKIVTKRKPEVRTTKKLIHTYLTETQKKSFLAPRKTKK